MLEIEKGKGFLREGGVEKGGKGENEKAKKANNFYFQNFPV